MQDWFSRPRFSGTEQEPVKNHEPGLVHSSAIHLHEPLHFSMLEQAKEPHVAVVDCTMPCLFWLWTSILSPVRSPQTPLAAVLSSEQLPVELSESSCTGGGSLPSCQFSLRKM